MRSLLIASATAAALTTLGFLSSDAAAQVNAPQAPAQGAAPVAGQAVNSHGANASRHGIAVVDVSYIFSKHVGFKATMDSMKAEMEKIEAELKADRDKIAQMEQQRNGYNVGSPEYKNADEEIARLMAEFNLKMTRLRKDFLEREAKVYFDTYKQVSNAVQYYAQRNNIGLVLRFNGEQVDPNRREEVLREINKPVVFQNQVDITGEILTLLNRSASSAGVQQPTQGAPRTAQPQAPFGGSQLPPR